MLNTIINRIEQLQFDGLESLNKLEYISNAAITYLRDRLKRPYPTAEMVECMGHINAALEKDYQTKFGNEKFDVIKTNVLISLNTLKSSYYDDPNNKPTNSEDFIDFEKKLSVENERELDFLIIEQKNIQYFKEQPAKSKYEIHGRLDEHYFGLNGEFMILKDSKLPTNIKNEFEEAFKKWKQNFVKN